MKQGGGVLERDQQALFQRRTEGDGGVTRRLSAAWRRDKVVRVMVVVVLLLDEVVMLVMEVAANQGRIREGGDGTGGNSGGDCCEFGEVGVGAVLVEGGGAVHPPSGKTEGRGGERVGSEEGGGKEGGGGGEREGEGRGKGKLGGGQRAGREGRRLVKEGGGGGGNGLLLKDLAPVPVDRVEVVELEVDELLVDGVPLKEHLK